MEVAVRSFVGDVSRFMETSLSAGGGPGPGGWEASYRQQLELLRRQLQELLRHYPSLRPSPAEPVADELYDDTGHAGDLVSDELYDDTGNAEEPVADELYDDTGNPEQPISDELYDDTGDVSRPLQEELYEEPGGPAGGVITDDLYEDPSEWTEKTLEPQEVYDELQAAGSTAPVAAATSYLSMVNKKAIRTLGIDSVQAEGKRAPPAIPAASRHGAAPAGGGGDSVSVVSGPGGADPEVVSNKSQTSQESLNADQVPAAALSGAARRCGRLQLRQDSKLWPYRPFWAGLAYGRLYLFRRETDAAQKRSINLAGYEVRRPPPGADVSTKRRPVCFELVRPGGRTHQLLALTAKDALQWMAALEAEGALAGRAEPEPTAPPGRPLDAPGPTAPSSTATAAAAAAAAASTATTAAAPPPQSEDLYAEADDEDIYDEISWPSSRPRSEGGAPGGRVVSYIEDDIYECIASPPVGAGPDRAPPTPSPAWSGAPQTPPRVASPGSPEPPPLPDRTPMAPPGQPPRLQQRTPGAPPAPAPAQPQRPPPRVPAAPHPALDPAAAQTPFNRPAPAIPAAEPTPSEPIEDELYDELNSAPPPPPPPTTRLPPPSDPFYNVLEPEYLAPRHPSPVPFRPADEPADEGYGNSSGGSEADGHPLRESHYKTLPRTPRPFTPPGRPASPAPPARDAEPPAAGPVRPTDLPSAARPGAGTAGGGGGGDGGGDGGGGGGGSVADVIRRLNRRSTSGDEPASERPRPAAAAVSAELARKQALIAGSVRALSPTGKPVAPPTKPTALPPKPKTSPLNPTASGQVKNGRPGGWPAGGQAGGPAGGPAAGLVPNKSAVYKTMQRLSGGENQSSQPGRRAGASFVAAPEPEEEDVYAEIEEDGWRT